MSLYKNLTMSPRQSRVDLSLDYTLVLVYWEEGEMPDTTPRGTLYLCPKTLVLLLVR